jgi:peptidoglycan/xylan/chitin deacetylase (PgdA/CDA1 family)
VHTFLLGYNLESSDWSRPGVTAAFLQAAVPLHLELRVPCTFFVRGQAIEDHAEEFRRARDLAGDLVDFQQYTYSALPLKTICQEDAKGRAVMLGGSFALCRDDVARAGDVMERVLGARPVGLCAPLGAYRGLADRPDLLEMLARQGIRFLRSYTRNARDAHPVPFEVQPFRYDAQGFPDLVEIPGQGWPDHLLREALGFGPSERCLQHLRKDLDYVATRKLTWSFIQHDWSSLRDDPAMLSTRRLLEQVVALGFAARTHAAFHREFIAAEKATPGAA